MKRLALLLLLLTGPAWAQPPEILLPEGQIELGVGESRTLRFQHPFKSASTVTKDIIDILPQSDVTFTVTGVTPGQTLMYLQDEQGKVTYTATVAVTASSGSLVKIYGRRGVKDFVGYYCSETGCGRADLDKKLANGGRDPDEPTATTVTQPMQGGGYVTKQYGPN